ncbi:sialidase family protein [Streptomyces sp. RFCAC02]|uniref:sialidase family protein n=1 Tax=Streptomyces sp. RFCAC02 TaxID=2499143 RepID=UPI00101FE499|nr:sialidase family protein [Streptomyces sp. RFCAC02]
MQGTHSGAGTTPPPVRTAAASVPFVSGVGGYASYRVPAAVATPEGTVVAFAEGRVGGPSDTGDIDVVARRSEDGGRTWGPPAVVAAGQGDTRGNPSPVVDPRSGRLVLLTTSNDGRATEKAIMRGEVAADRSRRVFVQFGTDDGRAFTAPREITAGAKRPDWRWYATGPGHGIALTGGAHAGRLVVPANHSAAPPDGSGDTGEEARHYGAHALLSDDGGRTWRVGYTDARGDGTLNPNESSVAELPDGRLYFSARDQKGTAPGNRAGAHSSDGGETLDGPGYTMQPTLSAVPVVQGAVLRTPGPDGTLLFSGPSDPAARRAMTLWRSDDGGAAFARVTTVSAAPAAYSDLVQVDRETVGLLYETGEDGPYESIAFRALTGL